MVKKQLSRKEIKSIVKKAEAAARKKKTLQAKARAFNLAIDKNRKKVNKNMARRKRKRYARRAKQSISKGMDVLKGRTGMLLSSFVYGYTRESVNKFVRSTPLGNINAGQLSDEAAILAGMFVIDKVAKPKGILKKYVDSAMAIESASAGLYTAQVGFQNLFSAATNNNVSGQTTTATTQIF